MFEKSYRLVLLAVSSFLYTAVYSQSNNAESSVLVTKTGNGSSYAGLKVAAKTAADSAWEAMPSPPRDISKGNRVVEALEYEKFYRKYYEEGLKFWHAFPTDIRRYEWLRLTSSVFVPRFWKSIEEGARLSTKSEFYSTPIDNIALKNWENNIEKKRDSYLNEPKIRKEEKDLIIISELSNVFDAAYNKLYWKDKDMFWAKINRSFDDAREFIADDASASERLVNTIDRLFLGSSNYSITLDELRAFVAKYETDNNSLIRHWAAKKLLLLNTSLPDVPVFSDPIYGSYIDIQKFKGKVVLLDYWNIYCSTCISRMPILRSLYEKYKDSGFEIVSISIDPKTQYQKVEKIKKEFGGDWAQIMIGGKDEAEFKSDSAPWKKIWDTYGFRTVPQMILYDQNGKVVTLNGALIFGDPEITIKATMENNTNLLAK